MRGEFCHMNKRMDKKKMKKQNTISETSVAKTPATPAKPKETIHFFIQYHDQEYLETEIISKVKDACLAQGASKDEMETISIYLKPEDKKAYFTYGKGKSGFIEL